MSWVHRRLRSDAGFTLLEMVVTLGIMSLAAAGALAFLDNTTSVTTRASADVATENNARLALRDITEDLRGATVISTTYPTGSACSNGTYPSGYSNCVSFTIVRPTAAGQTCPKSVVTYGLVGQTLRKDLTEYNASCTIVSSVSGSPVLTGVTNGTTTPVFTWFNRSGSQLTTTNPPGVFADAASIKVTLVVRYQERAPLLTLSSFAALRNNR